MDGPLTNDTVSYSYDELGRVTNRAINGVAQALSLDALGRVTAVTNALGSFTNNYLNATPRLSSIKYPNGQGTTFSYLSNTNDQRLQTIWHTNSAGATISRFDYTYDADGQIATWTQQADAGTPNVLVTEYDRADQLLGVTIRSNSVAGAILKQFVYGYDQAGNRTTERIDSGLAAANFNNLNQLTNIAGGGLLRFKGHLDELGTVTVAGTAAAVDSRTTNFLGYANVSLGTNVIPIVPTDYSSNKRTNNYQVVVTNNGLARTIVYDLNGNQVSVITAASTNTYEWDAANRLTKITQLLTNSPQLTSEFTYDGLGRRVRIVEKTNGIVQSDKRFLWCETELCEERDSTGATVSKRFFSNGEQISGTNYFFTADHLGSIREMSDSGGTIRARYDYDPYGRKTKVSGTLDADFAFTGHYVHTTSGMLLTLFRAYDAEAARWLNRDPIEEEGGINLYAYVGNNPINRVDPLGLSDEKGATQLMQCRKPDCRDDEKVSIWICNRRLGGQNGFWPRIGPLSHNFVACDNPANLDLYDPDFDPFPAFGKQPRPVQDQPGSGYWGPGYISPEQYLYEENEFAHCKEKKVCPKDKDRMCKEGPSQSPYFLFSPFHNCHAWANGRCK